MFRKHKHLLLSVATFMDSFSMCLNYSKLEENYQELATFSLEISLTEAITQFKLSSSCFVIK
jgi:hypothetical protein